jgi:cytochrome P450 family 142 subfamily A polypeptide 1
MDILKSYSISEKQTHPRRPGSADADIFEDPDTFRIDRAPNLHLAFGTGPHFCLGANLARTEIRILLEELFARLPDIHVPEGVRAQRGPNSLVTTISHLPVAFTPA